ncbi:MAG: squalene/phytoene synthase family protein [Nitrospirae bacterium]|nr:squalene/phytoene synthase family protein [Nitrospirota bacterium]MBI3352576.1 squalene/phytoene synthase family protein [Nitrospirota bacterium]
MKSNFYYSFFFLRPEEKEALFSFYSFCRQIDDEIDLPSSPADPSAETIAGKIKKIQTWRAELKKCFDGKPSHPLTAKLQPFFKLYHLTPLYFDEILKGMEMDIHPFSVGTFEELKLYCYRVASAVGLVCMEIFQDRSVDARECAVNLGIAFQMTNILRDIFGDLEKGRLYLPKEDLDRFSYSENDLKDHLKTDAYVKLIQFEIDRTKIYYQKAEMNLQGCENVGKNMIEVMTKTYYRLLLEIEKNILRLDQKTIALSTLNKLLIAGGVWVKSRFL